MNLYDDISQLPALRDKVREPSRQCEYIERTATAVGRKIQSGDVPATIRWLPAVAALPLLRGAAIIALLTYFILQGLR